MLIPAVPGGRRYWDGERWTEHCRADAGIARSPLAAVVDGVRRGWSAMPLALRLLLPIAFVLISAGIGVAFWLQSPPDNWARLPNHLRDCPIISKCRIQRGATAAGPDHRGCGAGRTSQRGRTRAGDSVRRTVAAVTQR
ncbi:DUF2510 domain-containing protein [Mycobacterium ulcerans]|uniref:DUF2510 domain-containing protein n=1 Tax=Mycobacterium ulcerans TaxID=1809 RepID=UPI00214B62A4|nr:DUF2510 domain-containing protein [Mycobacterium ulcerans]